MSWEQLADIAVGILVVIVGAFGRILWSHTKDIARLDAGAMTHDELHREIDLLRSEYQEMRREQREDYKSIDEKIDQIREALGTRKTDRG